MMQKTLMVYYSLTGVVDGAAHQLADRLGADLFRLTPSTHYDHDMWRAWEQAQTETAAHQLPTLTGTLPDVTAYDQIILGGPVWGYGVSNPVQAYLKQTDFQGKRVAAFWTYYDPDEKYESGLTAALQHANYLAGLELPMSVLGNQQTLAQTLDQWTQQLK
ncbi:flavodoxin [Lactobacillus sp. PFC-70]|nr:flavodoxin [Lactobacillus sp. PFC-70]